MGMPNPEYNEENQRTVNVSLRRLESQVEDLHLIVGEELVEVETDGDSVQFTVEQTDTEE